MSTVLRVLNFIAALYADTHKKGSMQVSELCVLCISLCKLYCVYSSAFSVLLCVSCTVYFLYCFVQAVLCVLYKYLACCIVHTVCCELDCVHNTVYHEQ